MYSVYSVCSTMTQPLFSVSISSFRFCGKPCLLALQEKKKKTSPFATMPHSSSLSASPAISSTFTQLLAALTCQIFCSVCNVSSLLLIHSLPTVPRRPPLTAVHSVIRHFPFFYLSSLFPTIIMPFY